MKNSPGNYSAFLEKNLTPICLSSPWFLFAKDQIALDMKMKIIMMVTICLAHVHHGYCWGFFAHQKINYYAVFLLPPQMLIFYKAHIDFIHDHAVDPDKRRYMVSAEGPRHFID